jgi:apolipoprotein N-acyltransferase
MPEPRRGARDRELERSSKTSPRSPGFLGGSPARLAGAFGSGALIVLSFPLFGSEVGLDGLIWVALVPLLLSAVGVGWRPGLFLGWCAGVTVEAAGFIWILVAIRNFTSVPWLPGAVMFGVWVLYSSIPWALLGAALGKCSRPSRVLWVLAFWVGLEHYFPRLFPWHLGGALHARRWLLQTVDIWGASGLTGLVFLGNACLFLLFRRTWRKEPVPWAPFAALGILLAGALGYGKIRLEEVQAFEERSPRFRVGLIQGCLDPRDKDSGGLEFYLEATRALLAREKMDLVLWPEGADSRPYDLSPGRDPWIFHRKEEGSREFLLRDEFSVPMVVGGVGAVKGRSPLLSNVAAYLSPGKPPWFYEKNIRVPFGEVTPGIGLVPRWLREKLDIPVGTIAAGTANPPFELGGKIFRNLICYEATLPGYFRRAARGSDFLVNVTEDIWYGRTAHVPQHVSVLRLRVVENRTPLLRATNVGPSGVMYPSGRFVRGKTTFQREEITVDLKAGSLRTVYQRGGFWLPAVLLGLSLIRWSLGIGRAGSGKVGFSASR